MRVALNGWFLGLPSTGTGHYLRELFTAADPLARQAGDEVVVISPRANPEVPIAVSVAPPRLTGDLGKVEFEHVTFPLASRARHFDIAHVPHFGPPLFPSIPTVVTIHDLIPLALPQYRGSWAVRLYTRLAALGARRAGAIIVDSQASRNDIMTHLGIPGERVSVIYLAADATLRPSAEPENAARVRSRYHLPEEFVLYLGGFDARKNVRMLIKAFAALQQDGHSGCKLVIGGMLPRVDSSFFPDPRAGAGEEVQFIGEVAEDDKPVLYSSALLFAYPSLYEGFGLPPLEAMACGTPVICSNAGSLPEVVGGAGILVDPSKEADWTGQLRALLSDDGRRRELRALGISQAAKFSWERTARATLEVYRSVLGNAAGSSLPAAFGN
jgi:glycosyltransferase involved in cell wall biosynthesis